MQKDLGATKGQTSPCNHHLKAYIPLSPGIKQPLIASGQRTESKSMVMVPWKQLIWVKL